MRKKWMALLLAAVMVLSLAACGKKDDTKEPAEAGGTAEDAGQQEQDGKEASGEDAGGRPTEGNGKIGFSTMTLGAEFFSSLDEAVHKKFESEGYEVVTVSCEMNAATQVSDIENLITMDCEAIVLFAADPEALTDVLIKAREAGIRVYPLACTLSNRDAYDLILGTDQYATGTNCAEMAAEWIDATFPDAADGSVEVAVIGNTMSQEAKDRTDGMLTITDLTSKAKVVETFDLAGASDVNIKSQEYADIITGKYPDVKVILGYGVDAELGVNEVYMRDSGLDRSTFGIFGVDTSDVAYENIKLSGDNESLIRGTVNLGDDLALSTYKLVTGEFDDSADENGYVSEPCKKVTLDNVDEFLK